jgi:hypothetical protein
VPVIGGVSFPVESLNVVALDVAPSLSAGAPKKLTVKFIYEVPHSEEWLRFVASGWENDFTDICTDLTVSPDGVGVGARTPARALDVFSILRIAPTPTRRMSRSGRRLYGVNPALGHGLWTDRPCDALARRKVRSRLAAYARNLKPIHVQGRIEPGADARSFAIVGKAVTL